MYVIDCCKERNRSPSATRPCSGSASMSRCRLRATWSVLSSRLTPRARFGSGRGPGRRTPPGRTRSGAH